MLNIGILYREFNLKFNPQGQDPQSLNLQIDRMGKIQNNARHSLRINKVGKSNVLGAVETTRDLNLQRFVLFAVGRVILRAIVEQKKQNEVKTEVKSVSTNESKKN